MILSRILLVTDLMMFGWRTVLAQLLCPASADMKLRITQQELDEDATGQTENTHAEALAK